MDTATTAPAPTNTAPTLPNPTNTAAPAVIPPVAATNTTRPAPVNTATQGPANTAVPPAARPTSTPTRGAPPIIGATNTPEPPATDSPTPARTHLPTIHMSVPRGNLTENSVIFVDGQARPNNTVDISADLSTTTVVNQKVVIYVRPGMTGTGMQPHTVLEAKRLPACRKGMRGCVAKTVTRRVTRTTVLYHATARVHADRTGRFSATLRLRYHARKAMRAMLTVTARTARGSTKRQTPVTVAPPAARKGAGKG